MKRKSAVIILAALVLAQSLTACQNGAASGTDLSAEIDSEKWDKDEAGEEQKEGAEESSEEMNKGQEIEHVMYGKVTLSEGLWNICQEIEKDTDGEISAEDAAMVLYYEDEDAPGEESPDALEEADSSFHGDHKEDYLNFIRESLELMELR
jgi:hypothetical protein